MYNGSSAPSGPGIVYYESTQSSTIEPGRALQVPSSLLQLDKNIECLSDQIRNLEQRLSPILQGQFAEKNAVGGEIRKSRPMLVEQIDGMAEKVSMALAAIENINHRLEL